MNSPSNKVLLALVLGFILAGAITISSVAITESSPVQESTVVQDVLQPTQVAVAPSTPPAPVEEVVNEDPQNCDPSEEELVAALQTLEENLSATKAKKYLKIVQPLSVQYEIDPLWIFAMIFQESGFDEGVVSSHGAVGLMQLMPSTAKDNFGVSRASLFDPATNIELGVKYLAQLRDGYGGDLRKAIIAYNQGVTNVNRGTFNTKYYIRVKSHYDKVAMLLNNKNSLLLGYMGTNADHT